MTGGGAPHRWIGLPAWVGVAALAALAGGGTAWAAPVPVPQPSGWTGWWSQITITRTESCRQVTIPSDVLFDSGDPVPGPGLAAAVREAVRVAAEVPGPVQVDGYLDDQGPENIPLSQARADNVAAALIAARIDPARVVATGRGESNPVASNTTPSGRARNRRVEIRIGTCPEPGPLNHSRDRPVR